MDNPVSSLSIPLSLSSSSSIKYRIKLLFFLYIILRLLFSIFSISYIHPDEYFQSYEIIYSLYPFNKNSHIPWEFANCINPCRSIIPPYVFILCRLSIISSCITSSIIFII